MGKKSKKCSSDKSRRMLWFAFSAAGLGARGLAALALVTISIKMHPLQYQSKSVSYTHLTLPTILLV